MNSIRFSCTGSNKYFGCIIDSGWNELEVCIKLRYILLLHFTEFSSSFEGHTTYMQNKKNISRKKKEGIID